MAFELARVAWNEYKAHQKFESLMSSHTVIALTNKLSKSTADRSLPPTPPPGYTLDAKPSSPNAKGQSGQSRDYDKLAKHYGDGISDLTTVRPS